MTALSGPILVIGVVLTALLFAFGVRRLLGLRLPLPRTLLAGVIAYLLVSPIINAIAGSAGTRDQASFRCSGLSSSGWPSRSW